eukprot:COSAG06_NODE_2420_length_6905_cov_5.610344_5_plen_143_part_00
MPFCRCTKTHLFTKTQARNKHRESTQKRRVFCRTQEYFGHPGVFWTETKTVRKRSFIIGLSQACLDKSSFSDETNSHSKQNRRLLGFRAAQLFGAYSPRGWGCPNPVRRTHLLRCYFIMNMIFYQDRLGTKHRENSEKWRFP